MFRTFGLWLLNLMGYRPITGIEPLYVVREEIMSRRLNQLVTETRFHTTTNEHKARALCKEIRARGSRSRLFIYRATGELYA